MSTTTTTFDAAALRDAVEGRDAAGLLTLYAPDARIEIADPQNPPSRPRVIEGRDAIAAHLEDVYGRDMTHEVELIAASDTAVGYTVRCSYPDGTRVLCSATAQLRDGSIAREVGVQVWDS
jgi:ketosteroid isomerase-like protein